MINASNTYQRTKFKTGSLWMIAAAFSFAVMSILAKTGANLQLAPLELLFWRSLIGAVALGVIGYFQGVDFRPKHIKEHFKRATVGYISMSMLFYALAILPAATAVTLNYTSSIFLTVFGLIFLKEIPNKNVRVSLLLGLIGVAFILKPTFDGELWFGGVIGLLSGVFAGLALFQVRQLGKLGESAWRVVFWFFVITSVVGLLIVSASTGFHALDLEKLCIVIGIGVFGAVGQLAMTQAYKTGNHYIVANLAYLTIVFTALLGAIIWHQTLRLTEILAIGLVIVSGINSARV